MQSSKDSIVASLIKSFGAARASKAPYPHWFVDNCLPPDAVAAALDLPFPAPALDGVSGKREVHNATRRYFDAESMHSYPVCNAVNAALQDPRVTGFVDKTFSTRLRGTYLRVEYAQDTNGFWLEPHTDLGVKAFTFLLYLSPDRQHTELGTDIYDADRTHVGRSPFKSNSAMIFVPASNTYHGFEARQIEGVRKSLVINFVTNDWRAREQLAYPTTPVA